MRVSLELEASRALRMLNGTAERAVNMQPAAEQILGDIQRLVGRQFVSAGADRGPKWAPYKGSGPQLSKLRSGSQRLISDALEHGSYPPRVRQKLHSKDARVRANAFKLLQATGAMRKGLTGKNSPSSATAAEVILAASVPYAGFHHRGTSKLPARPLVRLDARDTKRHARIILAHLTQASDPVSRRTRGESA